MSKELYKEILNIIISHPDFGTINPVDIGVQCGYKEADVIFAIENYNALNERQEDNLKYPQLKIDTELDFFEKEIYEFSDLDGIDTDAEFELMERTFKSESSCRDAYAELLRRPLNQRDAYVNEFSDMFIGNEITEHYALQIEGYINQICDYINIHNVEVNVAALIELRDNCRQDIIEYTKDTIKKLPALYKMESFSYYKGMLEIEETDGWEDSIFGDGRPITCYTIGLDRSCIWAVEQMAKEVTQLITAVANEVGAMVSQKYIARIDNYILQINQL